MNNNFTLNQTLRDELYAWNKIFIKNHINCREELFDSFYTLRNGNPFPGVEVWLAAVQEIEKYFVFTESQRNMFLIVAEYYYWGVENEFEEFPLVTTPQFHCRCEEFVCWFDTYLNREKEI